MVVYLVGGKRVYADGTPVDEESNERESVDESPFVSFSPAVQASLARAGVTTVKAAQELGLDGLLELDSIGEATAKKLLAL